MKFTNKKFKKGKLIISTLSLVLALSICIPFVRNTIYADTNSITFRFSDDTNTSRAVCKDYTIVYNGITYNTDPALPADGNNSIALEINEVLFRKSDSSYDNQIYCYVTKDSVRAKYIRITIDPDKLIDASSNKYVPASTNICDMFEDENIKIDFINVTNWPYNSYKLLGTYTKLNFNSDKSSKCLMYFDFVVYNDNDIVYTYRDEYKKDIATMPIISKGDSNTGSILLPSYKSNYLGYVLSSYSDDFSNNYIKDIDPNNIPLDYSKIIFAVYDKLRAKFDSNTNKVITNVSPLWKITNNADDRDYAINNISYQWKKIDLSKGYKLLNNNYDRGKYRVFYDGSEDPNVNDDDVSFETVCKQDMSGKSLGLDYDSVVTPSKLTIYGDSSPYVEQLEISGSLEEGAIIEVTTDKPVTEYLFPYCNPTMPSFALMKLNPYYFEGQPPAGDYSISEDRKTIFYKVNDLDISRRMVAIQLFSETDFKVTGINYYPVSALEVVVDATDSSLPDELDIGLYTCEVTMNSNCFSSGDKPYSVYSSPVQLGNRVTALPNYKDIDMSSSIKQKDIIVPYGGHQPRCYYVTKSLDESPDELDGKKRVFLGWSYEPNGNVLLDNVKITKDTVLYAIWKDVTELTYDKKTKLLDINPSVLWLDEEDGLEDVIEGYFPTNLITKQTLIYKNNSLGSTENNELDIDNYYLSYEDSIHYEIKINIVKEDDYSIKQGEKFTFSFLEGTEANVNQIEISEYNDTDTLFYMMYDTNEGDQIPKDFHYEVKNDNVNLEVIIYSNLKADIEKVKVVPYVDDDINGHKNLIGYYTNNMQDLDDFDVGSYDIAYAILNNDFNSIYLKTLKLNIIDTRHPEGGGGSGGSSHKKKTKETKVEEPKEDNKIEILMYIGKNEALVNGIKKYLDTAPFIEDEWAFLPVRFISENLKANVSWDEALRKVTVTNNDTTIILTIGSDIALLNDKEIKLDTKAFIKDDRTFIPIRFVSENLGCNVEWNKDNKEVLIKEKDDK